MPIEDEYKKRYHIVDEGDFVFLRKLYADRIIDWDPNQYLDALDREALWDRERYEVFYKFLRPLMTQLKDFFPATYCTKNILKTQEIDDIEKRWCGISEQDQIIIKPTDIKPDRCDYFFSWINRLIFLHWWLHCGAYKQFCESTDPKAKKSKINPYSTAAQPFIKPVRFFVLALRLELAEFSEISAYKKLNWEFMKLLPNREDIWDDYNKEKVEDDIKRRVQEIEREAESQKKLKDTPKNTVKNKQKYAYIRDILFADPSFSMLDEGIRSICMQYPLPQRQKIAEEMAVMRVMEYFHDLGDLKITDFVNGKRVTYVYYEIDLLLFYQTYKSWGTKDKRDKLHPLFENRRLQDIAVEFLDTKKTNFYNFYKEACKTVEYLCAGIFPMPTTKDEKSKYAPYLLEDFSVGNKFILDSSYSKANWNSNKEPIGLVECIHWAYEKPDAEGCYLY